MTVLDVVAPAFKNHPDYWKTYGDEVADLCELAGFGPDPEQRLGLDLLFAVDRRGKSVAFEFAVICSRQNLKTGLFKQAALGWLFITDQNLIVWSAHEFNTAQEAHRDMAALIEGTPFLAKRLKQVYNGAADKSIELLSGQRLIFKARTHTGGRGLSGDKVVLDEAFALHPPHMGALLPTLSVRPDPQVVYGSSAGLAESDVLRGIRDRGRSPSAGRLAYLEWGSDGKCERGNLCDHLPGTSGCALDQVENWQAANPLLGRTRANGTGLTVEYVRAERQAMPPLEFARERLGWWDGPDVGNAPPIAVDEWKARTDPTSCIPDGAPVVIAAEIALDRKSGSIGVAGWRADGAAHIELIDHRNGTDWLLAALLGYIERNTLHRLNRGTQDKPKFCPAVIIDPTSPAGTLVDPLRKAGIEPVLMTTREAGVAAAGLQDAVMDKTVFHRGQTAVETALSGAVRRDLGDGGWAFGRKKSAAGSVDITPLVVVTNARWALTEAAPPAQFFASRR
jgi:hypothetical protein